MSMQRVSAVLVLANLLACGSGSTHGNGEGGGEGGGSGKDGTPAPDAGSGGKGGGGGSGGKGDNGGRGGNGGATGGEGGGLLPRDAGVTSDASTVDTASAAPDASSTGDMATSLDGSVLPAPPAMWHEHWFEHVQDLKLVAYNDDVAIYFDKDVKGGDWIFSFMTRLWRYAKQTYDLGPADKNRLFAIFHQDKYGGGHPSTYFDDSHDLRNVSDCGPGPWLEPKDYALDEPSHESGHVVESANNGIHGSPAFDLWHDSKWMEFYQYDAYVALGMTADAKRLFDMFTATTDDFPRAGTHWFRDWFYPLWRDHGHAQVMVKFFKLLALHFPKNGDSYSRSLNWGEFVHFTSGAAGVNLKDLATTAFGWPADREAQFTKARADFPMITY
jgi:hypothetical protein